MNTNKEAWLRDVCASINAVQPLQPFDFEIEATRVLKTYKDTVDFHVEQLKKYQQELKDYLPKAISLKDLTKDQRKALKSIKDWLAGKDPYFVLRGFAGTGKSFMLQTIVPLLPLGSVGCSAPTNKATKILKKSLRNCTCKTIYSFLGLKMEAREDELVLTPSANEKIDLSPYKLLVVDEASMLTTEVLQYIEKARIQFGIKILFVGDPAQLPPVGEDLSPIWEKKYPKATLLEVKRHNNQILYLATHIRKHIVEGIKLTPVVLPKMEKSVWRLTKENFILRLKDFAATADFREARAIAWRNKTVDELNEIVREQIYTDLERQQGKWLVDDLVVVTRPIEEQGKMLATIDDEGIITNSVTSVDHETGIPCYNLAVKMETGITLRLRVVHETGEEAFSRQLGDIAIDARKPNQGFLWKKFWFLRNRFHEIKHGYAITSHRSQGSTFKTAFVEADDILRNPDKETAYRCLYVASSRASDDLYITGLPKKDETRRYL